MKSQDSKFLKGAFVLTAAGLLVKIMGALYRIPLYSLLGSEGMGLFQMAYPIYAMLLTVSSAGLNVAISKAVAERWVLGRKRDARGVFRVSLLVMSGVGMAGSLALFLARTWIAMKVAKDPRASLCIAAISPALFLSSILSALRGWFQGLEEMVVPAVSQVVEQVGRLSTMFILTNVLLPSGLERAAAGATFGATVGAGVGVLYAGAAYWVAARGALSPADPSLERRQESWTSAVKAVVGVAVPISLASAVFGLSELVDLSIVPARLQAGGVASWQATRLYGQFSGAVLPLINLATVFTGALQVSVVPSITAAVALRDRGEVRRRAREALALTAALALPASVGLFVLAEPIPLLLYKERGLGEILKYASPAFFFLAIQQVSSGILQGMGRISTPLANLGIALAAKSILTYALVGMPAIGIRGAAASTSLYFGIAATLNVIALERCLDDGMDPSIMFKLCAASSGMALVAGAAYSKIAGALGSDLGALAAIGAGAISYLILAAALKTFNQGRFESISSTKRHFLPPSWRSR